MVTAEEVCILVAAAVHEAVETKMHVTPHMICEWIQRKHPDRSMPDKVELSDAVELIFCLA